MKQLNALESHLDLKLITRTHSGIKLTWAGEIIYRDAKFIIDYSGKSISEAKCTMAEQDAVFCVGTSMLNPAKPFMDIWYKINSHFPNYKIHLVPFDDDHRGILKEIEQLGKKFDFLIGVCDSKSWLTRCGFLPLGRYKKMIVVSRNHRLANKEKIEITDLYGETLMMVKRGDSPVNDYLRNDLKMNHPEIRIEDTQMFYDLSVFNHCAETGKVLLTIECRSEVHPALVSVPVNWEYSIPYGLLYNRNAPGDVLDFVDKAGKFSE